MPEAAPSLDDWVGKEVISESLLEPFPLSALAATLDLSTPKHVPPLWHWLYFIPATPASAMGPDGHPALGQFLPPIPLPRRMWAGSRFTFHQTLFPGKPAKKVSTIRSIEFKTGRTGRLAFVTVSHEVFSEGILCIEEEQDIVYREASIDGGGAKPPTKAPAAAHWTETITTDSVRLFRYSALTFNSHRIHYDHPYATQIEGYPDLVVHGPLIATLLAGLVSRHAPNSKMTHFSFRAVRPTFVNTPFTLCATPSVDGTSVALWAQDADGNLTVQAEAALTPL